VVTFVGEFLLAVWLVIWGREITLAQDAERQGNERAKSRG
jgi:hypothetical protein